MSRPRPWDRLSGTPWYRKLYFDALALASPARAAISWHFDRMDRDADYRDAAHCGMRALGYATQAGPNKASWPTNGTPRSADAEVIPELGKLRERARILGRIDPVGSGLIRQFTREMIGSGIHDRAATGDPKKDAAINAEWEELQNKLAPAELADWPVVQYILGERLIEDGEVWPRAVKRSAFDPLTFEIVEGERVDSPADVLSVLAKGHSVREGVERDAGDRIVAYWIAKSHPGDVAIPQFYATKVPLIPLSVKDYDRVIPEVQAKHVRLPGRPGQSRSVTLLHAVEQNLRDMDLVVEAGVKRIQVAASFAVFIETAAEIPDLVSATAKKYHYQLDQDLVPGMIFVLRPGDKATTINPNFPVPDLKVLQEVLARRIGAALGISWRVVLSDLGEANFSAARADRIEFEESAAIPRLLLVGGLDWMRRLALEDALLRGSERLIAAGVTVEDLAKTSWLRREKKWLDPRAEADGASVALKEKLVSKRDYFAGQGKDWQEEQTQQLAEEAYERQERARLKLGGDSSDDVGPQWVTALQNVLVAVGAGELDAESATQLILVSFPKVTKEQAAAMVEPAKKLAATKPETPAPVPGAPAATPPANPAKPRHLNGAREVSCA